MNFRALALAFAVAVPSVVSLSPSAPFDGPRPAAASVAVLVSFEELVNRSSHVIVATAGEQKSLWEELPSGRRIVTYTRLAVERTVAGPVEKEIWVRTLGGVVDKIGQSVSGEASFVRGARALVFVSTVDGQIVVTGRAQGHYPIVEVKDQAPTLASSPDAGALLPRRGPTISARERLVGTALEEAISTVKQARRSTR
ncbi:MAG: hypothetical protein ABI193_05125 [Minicystis sp.]